MKINPNSINKIYATQTKTSTNSKEVSAVNNVDKVEVSLQAKQNLSLQKIKSELTSSLNTDYTQDKMSELKALIKSGKYEVKHRQVAEALIAFSESVIGNKND